jgi:hypothetical protein
VIRATGRWVFKLLGIVFDKATLIVNQGFRHRALGSAATSTTIRHCETSCSSRQCGHLHILDCRCLWIKDPIMIYGLIAAAYSEHFEFATLDCDC